MITETTKQQFIERLFKTGGHYGFQKSRRHPTVTKYLFGSKDGTDIIDLEKTTTSLLTAMQAIESVANAGGEVLFVGTKPEASNIVREIATEVGAPYVSNRWVGGILTNFVEVRKRIARLHDLVAQGESGELDRKYTKKERVIIGREMQKLTFNFGGIRKVEKMPKLVVVVDPRHDSIAVEEAKALNIPIVSLSGSDNNLVGIAYPVVVNDTLTAVVRATLGELAAAYAKGKSEYVPPAQVHRTVSTEERVRRFAGRTGERKPFSARREGRNPRPARAEGGRPRAPRAPMAER